MEYDGATQNEDSSLPRVFLNKHRDDRMVLPDDITNEERLSARPPLSSTFRVADRSGEDMKKPSLKEQVIMMNGQKNKAEFEMQQRRGLGTGLGGAVVVRKMNSAGQHIPPGQIQDLQQTQSHANSGRSSSPAAHSTSQHMLPSQSRDQQQIQHRNDTGPPSSPPAPHPNDHLVPGHGYAQTQLQVSRRNDSGRSSSPAVIAPRDGKQHQRYIAQYSTPVEPISAESAARLFVNATSLSNSPRPNPTIPTPHIGNPTNSGKTLRADPTSTTLKVATPRSEAQGENIASSPTTFTSAVSRVNSPVNHMRPPPAIFFPPQPNPTVQPSYFDISPPEARSEIIVSSPHIITSHPDRRSEIIVSSPTTISSVAPHANTPINDMRPHSFDFSSPPPAARTIDDLSYLPFRATSFAGPGNYKSSNTQKAAERPLLDDIFDVIEGRAEVDHETYSRSTALAILNTLRKQTDLRQKQKNPAEKVQTRVYYIDESILAIFKIRPSTAPRPEAPLFSNWHYPIMVEDEDRECCSFCTFECDFGVSDERVWMDLEASGGWCQECHESTISFTRQWGDYFDVNPDFCSHVDEERVKELKRLDNGQGAPLKEFADQEKIWVKAEHIRLGKLNRRNESNSISSPATTLSRRGNGGLMPVPVMLGAIPGPSLPQNIKGIGLGGTGNDSTLRAMRNSAGIMMGHGAANPQQTTRGISRPSLPHHMQGDGFRGPKSTPMLGMMGNFAVTRPEQYMTTNGPIGSQKSASTYEPPQQMTLRGGCGGSPPRSSKNGVKKPPSQKPTKSNPGSHTKPIDVDSIPTPKPPTSLPTIKTNPEEDDDQNTLATQHPMFGGKEPLGLTKKITAQVQKKTGQSAVTPLKLNSQRNLPLEQPLEQISPLHTRSGAGKSWLTQPEIDDSEEKISPLHTRSGTGKPGSAQPPADEASRPTLTINSNPATTSQTPANKIASAKRGGANAPSTTPTKKSDSTNKKINVSAPNNAKRPAPASSGLSEPKAKKARNEAEQPTPTPVSRDPRPQKGLPVKPQGNALAKGTAKVNERGAPPDKTLDNMRARRPQSGTPLNQVRAPAKEKADGTEAAHQKATNRPPTVQRNGVKRKTSSDSLMQASNKPDFAPNILHSNPRPSGSQLAHMPQFSTQTPMSSQVPMADKAGSASVGMGTVSMKSLNASSPTYSSPYKSTSPLISSTSTPSVSPQCPPSAQNLRTDAHRSSVPQRPSHLRIAETASPPRQQLPVAPTHPVLQPLNMRQPAAQQQHTRESIPEQRRPQVPLSQQSPLLHQQAARHRPASATISHQRPPQLFPPARTYSPFDRKETTRYQQVLFCRGCPWRQVDVDKARICEPCRQEKLAIIHHRHLCFISMCDSDLEKRGYKMVGSEEVAAGRNVRNCMICPQLASYKCDGCPLRLCVQCKVFLLSYSKGHLTNLFYAYHRNHIRNDAFLLRGDGGGF